MSRAKPTVGRHLPCPECEYDLFGLIDEHGFVRCPECGEHVDIEFAIKQVRVRKVKITFLWLVLCVASFVPVAATAALCVATIRIWCVALLAVSSLVWLAVLWAYRQRHREVDYAGWALLMFHGCFVLGSAGVLWIVYVVLFLAPRNPSSSFGITLGQLLLAVPFLCAPWWLYWRACGLIEDGHDLLLHRTLGRPL